MELLRRISVYQTPFEEEAVFIDQFKELLQQVAAFQRHHLPGHITGSAWITDDTNQYALLTHHANLNRWLQPGGHADGDENIINVAFREAREETGLTSLKLIKEEIFDLDIHQIPARKNFPEHLHFDVRIHFVASIEEALVISEESHDLAWVPLTRLRAFTKNNRSIQRMAEKITRLLGTDQ